MTHLARVAEDGSLAVPVALAQQIGARPGDLLSIERDGPMLVVRVRNGADTALARLREAMRGYSVDRFLAERREDWGE